MVIKLGNNLPSISNRKHKTVHPDVSTHLICILGRSVALDADALLNVVALLRRGEFVLGGRVGGQQDPQGGGEEAEGAGGVKHPGPACGGGDQTRAGHRHHRAEWLTFNTTLHFYLHRSKRNQILYTEYEARRPQIIKRPQTEILQTKRRICLTLGSNVTTTDWFSFFCRTTRVK
jgi:hypothetical protein